MLQLDLQWAALKANEWQWISGGHSTSKRPPTSSLGLSWIIVMEFGIVMCGNGDAYGCHIHVWRHCAQSPICPQSSPGENSISIFDWMGQHHVRCILDVGAVLKCLLHVQMLGGLSQ
jgi:hypothetical protein